jgi:hypothetical protein
MKRRASRLQYQNAVIRFQAVRVQRGAALQARFREQQLEFDRMRSVLTRCLRETPKGEGVEKYLGPNPATHSCVVDRILEI